MARTIEAIPVKINSLRPALAELERAVQWAYALTGDRDKALADVTVTVQTKGRLAYCAWFNADKWETKEGAKVHEINMSAEHLFDDPIDIIGYIVHEVVHLNNHDFGIKDVSKGGRHNKKFGELASDLGLAPAGPEGKEWNSTKLGEVLRERVEKEFQPDYAALALFRTVPEKKKGRKSTRSWHCEGLDPDCTKVQVPAKKILLATCEYCSTKFQTDEVTE